MRFPFTFRGRPASGTIEALPSTSAAPAARPSILGIGHSHLVTIQESYQRRVANGELPTGRFIQLGTPALEPNLLPDGTIGSALAAVIEAGMQGQASEAGPPFVFDSVSGNEYHFIGLVNHPRPYDFVLPSRPDLPLRPDAEIIPAALMRRVLRAQMMGAYAVMRALRATIEGPILHVQSPPPLSSNDFIRDNPIQFADQIAERGVAPPGFRMKLWLLQSELYRAFCDELGFGFLPVPRAGCDAEGFLAREGWRPDPAHANNWYGLMVLEQIEQQAVLAQRSRAA